MNLAMVMFMKKIRFVAMLTVVSLFYFVPINSGSVVADTVPQSSTTSISGATPTSSATIYPTVTSTSLPEVMPAAHSAGKNSYLTIADLPYTQVYWGQCQYKQQVYCTEPTTVISASGSESVVPFTIGMGKGMPVANCHNNSHDNTKLCNTDGSDWMEIQLGGEFTQPETSNTYHWKVRTGKISPDILMLGDTQKTVVSGNANDGWAIEIWAKPTLKAYDGGCFSVATCSGGSVASRVSYNIMGYARMLGINAAWNSVASESLRTALRGTFITTNGGSQSWAFSSDTFFVTAMSAHFLPPDASGKSEVAPGYVKVFLPESYLTLDRGYKNLSMVTADRVKLTVSGENTTAKVTKVDGGLLVDTGVEHFSAPNPEMMVLKANDAATSVMTETTTIASTSNSIAVVAKLKKGASKTLSSIAKTKAAQKPKWSASGKCKIVGSKVVALKVAGTCKVTLRVLNSKKKYVVQATKTFKVS